MRTLQRVCVAVDLATEPESILSSAAVLARRAGAVVHLVTVVEPIAFYQHVVSPVRSGLAATEDLEARAEERLTELAAHPSLAGLDVERHVRVGKPFAEIVGTARQLDADLLVIGKQHSGGVLERVVFGSTAERVIRKAPIPVLLVSQPLHDPLRVVLAPTDFSSASRPAVEEAAALARTFSARLILLHAIDPVYDTRVWPNERVVLYLAEPEELEPEWEAFLKSVDLSGISWEKHTLKGHTVPTILDTAQTKGADLIIVGTHGRSGLAHALLGSTAEETARKSPIPVLSVRPEGFEFTLP